MDQDPYVRYKRTPKEGATEKIAERISDITLTIESSDYVDVPPPVVENIFLDMPEDLRSQYRRLEKKLVLELTSGVVIDAASMGVLVQKLLQFTSGCLLDENREVHALHSLKRDTLKHALKTAESPMLVARWFNHEKDMFRPRMCGKTVVMAESAKTARQERELMAAWNAGNIDVLVANRRSLGHGLNLQHGGHEILHTSLTHDRDAYDQFNGRMIRTGQKHHVRVRHIVMRNTVDEAVLANLAETRAGEQALFRCLKLLQAYRTNSAVLL